MWWCLCWRFTCLPWNVQIFSSLFHIFDTRFKHTSESGQDISKFKAIEVADLQVLIDYYCWCWLVDIGNTCSIALVSCLRWRLRRELEFSVEWYCCWVLTHEYPNLLKCRSQMTTFSCWCNLSMLGFPYIWIQSRTWVISSPFELIGA